MEDIKAVILAGGRGTRLRPYTLVLPKPLIPVGDQPVLGLLLKQLCRNGIRDVYVTLGYCASLIRTLLSQEVSAGLNISCVEEELPLGTIGSLRLVQDQLHRTFIVSNGDVLTDLDLRKMVDFHQKHGGVATIACYRRKVTIPYGLVRKGQGTRVVGFAEKPERQELVNMGVYVFSPEILRFIPPGIPFGADDLIHTLLDRKLSVHYFLHRGLWMDIGEVQDLQEAQDHFETFRDRFHGD